MARRGQKPSRRSAKSIHRPSLGTRRLFDGQQRFRPSIVETLEQRLLLTAGSFPSIFDLSEPVFASNPGQLEANVAYVSHGADVNLSLLKDGALLEFGQANSGPTGPAWMAGQPQTAIPSQVRFTWQGGNESPSIIGLGELPVTNHFSADVTQFARVRYDEVYDGIDLEYYGRDGHIEFDWIVEAGVDPSQIAMVYAGMDDLAIDAAGNLVLSAGDQQIAQHAPVTYQVVAGEQRKVASSYRLDDSGTVRFVLGEYDPSLPLVIDPVLSYSTYLGGDQNDLVSDIAADADGNTYVIGSTASSTLAGIGIGDNGYSGAYLTKFKPDGQIEYTTLLGPTPTKFDVSGYTYSVGASVAVGPDGLPYVVFETIEGAMIDSGDGTFFPLPGTFQMHIAKLDEGGVPLFDTVMPESDEPTPTAPLGHHPPYFLASGGFALDQDGSAYLTYQMWRPRVSSTGGDGFTEIQNFISKVGPDGEIEFTEELSVLPAAIAIDAEHNIYLAATTDVDGLYVSENAFQAERKDHPFVFEGDYDVYVAQLDPTASGILAATYLGGSSFKDIVSGLAINPDQPGVVYLAGATASPDFPLKDPFQARLNNSDEAGEAGINFDGFITVLNLETMELLASTFLGGSDQDLTESLGGDGDDTLSDIALDQAGNVYVVGQTNSLDFPVVDPLRAIYTPGPTLTDELARVLPLYDFVIAKFDASLSTLEFSTYFGGSGHDSWGQLFLNPYNFGPGAARIAVDSGGTIHVAGISQGTIGVVGESISTADFPVLNAVQPDFAGGFPRLNVADGATDGVVFAISQPGVVEGRSVRATQGREFTGVVAEVRGVRPDAALGDFQATIDWGDGSQSAGSLTRSDPASATLQVIGSHTYANSGAYPVVVTVTDTKTGLDPLSNINVSHYKGVQFEPSIAVDPNDSSRAFAVAVDETGLKDVAADIGGGIFAAVSSDGGLSWSPRRLADGSDDLPLGLGDPKAVFDEFGNLFVTYLGAARNNVVLVVSKDGGKTFRLVGEFAAPGSSPGGSLAVDQPSVAVGAGSVWMTWEDKLNHNVVAAGAAVTGLDEIGSLTSFIVPGSDNGGFGDVKIGPQGQVLVIWQTDPNSGAATPYGVFTSMDADGLGPEPLSAPRGVASTFTPADPFPFMPTQGIVSEFNLAWDVNLGEVGRVYVAFTEPTPPPGNPNDFSDLDVKLMYSDDAGATWHTPVKVSDAPAGTSQFLPSIAVDELGRVAVGWYDTRNDAEGKRAQFFAAVSNDHGVTFASNVQLSKGTSDATTLDTSVVGRPKGYGDYSTIAFTGGILRPIWSDNSEALKGNPDRPQFDVATSVVGVIDVGAGRVSLRTTPIEMVGNTFNGAVATFTHPDVGLGPEDFSAAMTIHWGDGSTSPGVITQPGGPGTEFLVTGNHVYAEAGAYPLWVHVRDLVNGLDATPVSNVTSMQGSQAEATIAIDPTNPDRVFAAAVEATKRDLPTRGLPVSVSNDGGVTWASRVIADGSDHLPHARADPRAVFDQFGNLFLTYLSLTDTPGSKVVVLLSTDGGRNFRPMPIFASPHESEDFPSITVGPGQEPGQGSVWLTWEHSGSGIRAAGATVDGLGQVGTFNEVLIAAQTGELGSFELNFGDIAIGPDGQVLLSYFDHRPSIEQLNIHLDPDGLGPQPFGPAVPVTESNVRTGTTIPAQDTTRGIVNKANLAWDRSDGPNRGRVYLVYTDAVTLPDTNILLRYSDVDGASWSEPIQVNDDGTTNSQFFPSIAVDQSTGNVGVGWHSGVENNVETRFVATISDDGGSTFRVAYEVSPGKSDSTDISLDPNGALFSYGDYTGLSFVNGMLQPIWADNSVELRDVPDPRQFDLANARIAVIEVLRAPLIVQTLGVTKVEGDEFTAQIATFTDPGGALAATAYHATIDWGDDTDVSAGDVQARPDGSFAVLGTHDYERFGDYAVTITIRGARTKVIGATTATITNAPIVVAIPANLRVVRELEFTKEIATFTDLNHHSDTTDFEATINWGDGTFSDGMITLTQNGDPGQLNIFSISGTHTYLAEQTFTVIVSVREIATSQQFPWSGPLVSGDPPLVVAPGDFLDIEALAGINTGDLVLVTFTVPEDIDVELQTGLGEYAATINWGDGQVDFSDAFVTSDGVTVVGRHTYFTAGQYFPSVTVEDDSGGVFTVPLVATVEPDVTSQVRAIGSGLVYNPVIDRFVGELNITNTSTLDISGPLFVVIHDLPPGVTLDSFTAIDGEGNPLYKVDQSRLSAGASLPPIPLEFSNPSNGPISYTVQVFDGIRPEPLSGAGLVFEPNLGQTNDSVSYLALGSNYSIGLAANHATLVLRGDGTSAGAAAFMEWVGGNDSPTAMPLDPLPGVSNYLLGDSSVTGVPHYGRVRYASVYDGIDLEYYGREGLLEYDWIVRPGADVSAIAMRFHGVDEMLTDSAGNLRLQMDDGELVQRAPIAYQLVDGQRHIVTASFVLQADGTVTFAVSDYDPALPLVIDPVLVYSTYFGGSTLGFGDAPNAVAVDGQGNSYITGRTFAPDFPTVNPFDNDLNDQTTFQFFVDRDAFVTKLDPNGMPIFSTYLGGSLGTLAFGTEGFAIAVDASGSVWLGGLTNSPSFPAMDPPPVTIDPNPFPQFGGFLTQFTPDGSAIMYSTIFPGNIRIEDIALDGDGTVYALGNLNVAAGFALKFDPTGADVPWVKYLGGRASGIAVDDLGQIYIGGSTNSPGFPIKNALFPVLRTPEVAPGQTSEDRAYTGFVTKLSTAGDVLFSTYLGGSGGDFVTDLAVDGAGVIYVVGQTNSNDLPVPGGLDTLLGGDQDGFLIKLANDGSAVLYGTYIGGSLGDFFEVVNGVAVDAQGRTYLAGTTNSTDLPTVHAHQPTFGGAPSGHTAGPDGFAASLSADGGSFDYLTYWGGTGYDEMFGVSADALGNATYVGWTNSLDLPTYNSWQQQIGGAGDLARQNVFIVRLLAGDAGTITLHNAPITAVEGSPFNGLVAFFESNGTETADQFAAIIDWGDGLSSAGTIIGDFRSGFQVLGNHLYTEIGSHDVFVTLRDSLGRAVTATSTGTLAGATEGRAHYHVVVDTAALVGAQGLLSFQFNPGAMLGSPDAEAHVTALNLFGGALGGSTFEGDAVEAAGGELTLRPFAVLNRLIKNVTLGTRIEFDLEFTGPGLSQPSLGDFADVFALQFVSATSAVPLLGADSTGSMLRVILAPDGSTQAHTSGGAVTVAASRRATVANGPINLTLAPFTVQEGLAYDGPVATFTSGNPLESAGEFAAQIDWGDGSPVTTGIVSGAGGSFTVSGSHVYQTVGSYALAVTVVEPDGLEVSLRSRKAILAALQVNSLDNGSQLFTVSPVSGDFNGDGILDVVVEGNTFVPTFMGRGVGILLGRGDGSFELSGFQTTGQVPAQLAVGDFNNDGKLDVAAAIANFGQTVVELLLGNGDGTLQPTVQLTDLKNPGNLAAADFNRDGSLDLAYTESLSPNQHTGSDTLKVALGHGNGTFDTPTSITIPYGIHSVYVADMNSDGVSDIVLASSSLFGQGTTLQFLRGVGDGNFDAPLPFFVAAGIARSLAIEDFDGDAKRDVAYVNGATLSIFRGNGDGSFNSPAQLAVSAYSNSVAAGDFNRDGRPDLAIGESAGQGGTVAEDLGRVRVFLNDGAGNFAVGVAYDGVSAPLSILTADFDRDGLADIATSGNTTVLSVFPGLGDGTFASASRYATGLPGFGARPRSALAADVNGDSHTDAILVMSDGSVVTELGNGDGSYQSVVSRNAGMFGQPILVDVNNDGRLDILSNNPSGDFFNDLSGINITLGTGDGAFPANRVDYFGAGATTGVELADFNQDGRLDMAVATGSTARVSVFLANAGGTFQNAVHYATGIGAKSVAVGDFNADSRLDLAVVGAGPFGQNSTLSVLLGNADGTFAPAVIFPTAGSPEAVRVGDFDRDGDLDLVIATFSGSVRVVLGNGNGTFAAELTFATTGSSGHDVEVGDFNSDGNPDIVVAHEFSGLSVLLGNGNGTFQAAVNYATGSQTNAVALGDFNADGRLDIAATNFGSNNVSILLGNANGTFQNAVNYATVGAGPRSVAVGDFNADGRLDLAVANRFNDVAIFLGNGNGTFGRPLNYSTNGSPLAVAIGDLNGDGRADVAVANGGISLLLGNGDGSFPNRLFTYIPPTPNFATTSRPEDVAAGDLNGDGNIDLVVSISGATAILLGNGNGSFQPPTLLTPPAASGLGFSSNRVGLVDMDGDGDLDLITLHSKSSSGAVAVWRNNGTGTFSTPLLRDVPIANYSKGVDMEIGDLNGDGHPDVVVTDVGPSDQALPGGASVLIGVGDGSLTAPVRYITAQRQRPFQVTLADLDRDGRPEIVALTSPNGFLSENRTGVAVFTNRGDGAFAAVRFYDHGGDVGGYLAAGDFNGDGAADVIVPHYNNVAGSFSIIFAGDRPFVVLDAPVTVIGVNLNPRAGAAFTATVATFTDDNPFGVAGDFTATINWGDGQTSTGSIHVHPLGGFGVTGSHTYASAGVFTTTVTVRETGEGTHAGSATARVSAIDQALVAAGLDFDAIEDLPFTGVVATFTDADPNGSIGDFGAVIDWGDGQSSAGVIAQVVGGGFSVIGIHTYANPGTLPVRVDIADIGGSTATANSTAHVASHVNQAPVAFNDSYTTNEDTTLAVAAAVGVLANDTDTDGDALGAVVLSLPAHGTITLTADGSFTYTPAANFVGNDSFTYKANDGSSDSEAATVNITVNAVNDAPVANDDSAATNEDAPIVINVLANDTDGDSAINPATVVFTGQPIHGTVQADVVTGALTYTPVANFFGSDSLRYRVRDTNGLLSNEAVVSITVNTVNDAPVAIANHYATVEDTPLTIAGPQGVLANDKDADGNPLTALLVFPPAHGSLTLNIDGSFSYTPAAEFSGSDSFSYRAFDGNSQSETATVSLIVLPVNDDPVVSALSDQLIDEGDPFTNSGSFFDRDPDDSWTATVDYGDGTGIQPLVLVGFDFALNHNYLDSGEFIVRIRIMDQGGVIAAGEFKIIVQNLAATVEIGTDKVSSEGAIVRILGDSTDPGLLDTHTATINWGDGTATQPMMVHEAGGAGTILASHAYADDNVYLVTVTVTDDEGASASDTLTVTVGNVAPRVEAGIDRTINVGALVALPTLFTSDVFIASFGASTLQTLAGSFVDPGALDSHTATVDWGDGTVETVPVDERTFGSQGVPSGVSGAVRGTHFYTAAGSYTVLISVMDDDGGIGSGSFVVLVESNPNNSSADAGPDQTVVEGAQVALNGSFVNSDPNDTPTYLWHVTSSNGQVVADGNAPGFNFTPNDNGAYTATFTVTTGHGVFSDSAIISVTNALPSAALSGPASGSYGQTLTYALGAQDPSSVDQLAGFVYVVHWGDGTPDTTVLRTAGNATGLSVDHVFASAGPFLVQVTSTDKDGGISLVSALSVEVAKAHLSVSADGKTKVYGAANPPLTSTISGFQNGETQATSGVSGQPLLALVGDGVHVGNYVITVAIGSLNASNYDFPVGMLANGTLNVTPAPLTITAQNKSKVYGAVLPTLTAGFSGFVNGDTPASLTTLPTLATTATAASHVGNYPIAASGALDADYAISYAPGTLGVTPAPLTITAENKSKVYGAAIVALTAAYDGLVNGDTPASLDTPPTLATTATAASHVGNYPITVDGALDADYTIDLIDGLFAVTPAQLTIRAQDKSKLYGAAIVALTAAYDGLVNGDTPASLNTQPALATTATAASAVGSYPISASGAADPDYTITHMPGIYSVTPAPLTIRADDKSKTEGTINPPLTYTPTGFVNGDTAASLAMQPTLATTATTASLAGMYPITASGASSPNYTIAYVSGTLTVTPSNLAPVAVNDATTTNKNTAVVINVLANDSDPEGALDPTTVTIVGGASHGTISINPTTGAVTYTPALNYIGPDSFTYKVKDNRGADSNVATVSITVRDVGLLHGSTATIGFWANPNGQALINSFGKTSSGLTLANWLATTFPNLYGGTSKNPNYLVNKTNAQVAALLVKLFNGPAPKADAQVMATALAIFSTTSSLNTSSASRALAIQYGFQISSAGAGATQWNVGANGAAFSLPNNSTTSLLDLLKRVNGKAVKGKLYNGDKTLIKQANVVFSQINEAGDIGP